MKLSDTQQRIVAHQEGALLVVAGPGSGKTRVLTERIRRLLADGNGHFKILALTFTNKAANEMKERLEEIIDIHQRTFIGTLHSFCVDVLSNRGIGIGIDGIPNIFEQFQDRKQVLREAVLADPELAYELRGRGNIKKQDQALTQWLGAISESKSQLLLAESVDDPLLGKIYQAYDDGLRNSNAVDYDDLLLLTYRLFVERPKVADFYRRVYRYICIDEAQDLNEAQYRVLRALCGENYKNVMLVGDPKQAIFQWNGANPKYLDLFEKDFSANRIQLSENFRSSAKVVEIAKRLTHEYDISSEYPITGKIDVLCGDDEGQEALSIIDYIQSIVETGHPDIEGKVSLDRIAILARNRYIFDKVESLIKVQNWPYYKQLSTQHESESSLLQDFELLLRILANTRDRLHFGVLVKRWGLNSNIDLSEYKNFSDLSRAIEPMLLEQSHRELLSTVTSICSTTNKIEFNQAFKMLELYANTLKSDEDRELILQDIAQWRHHWDVYVRSQSGGHHNLASFLGQVALGATQQPRHDGLALLTVHSAKGLEFDVVIIMGMMEGVFPDYRATGTALDEERRNLFVAVTRSKRLLCFTYSKSKLMPWGDTKMQRPSRFLKDIGLVD